MRLYSRVLVSVVLTVFLAAGSAFALPNEWPVPPFDPANHNAVELVGFLAFIAGTDFHQITDTSYTVSGTYDVTVIGWEAADDNVFRVDRTPIFDNSGESNFGSWVTVDFDQHNVDFKDTTYYPDDPHYLVASAENINKNVELWVLETDVTLNYLSPYLNDVFLPEGTIIAGFNDSYCDDNHDDMIMAYKAVSSSVPEPTTLLLVGTGLVGLAAYRRKFKS